jgi:hypothetical protein
MRGSFLSERVRRSAGHELRVCGIRGGRGLSSAGDTVRLRGPLRVRLCSARGLPPRLSGGRRRSGGHRLHDVRHGLGELHSRSGQQHVHDDDPAELRLELCARLFPQRLLRRVCEAVGVRRGMVRLLRRGAGLRPDAILRSAVLRRGRMHAAAAAMSAPSFGLQRSRRELRVPRSARAWISMHDARAGRPRSRRVRMPMIAPVDHSLPLK